MSSDTDLLDFNKPVAHLAAAMIDVPSVSGEESVLADGIEDILQKAGHLEVLRHQNTVVARTQLARSSRVVWAGHLDTVPINDNVPHSIDGDYLVGRGSVDMKAGVAIGLKLAMEISQPRHDMTWIFYDNEEVEAAKNGLGLLGAAHPDWVAGDFAIVGEPSHGVIEGGCNGTLRCEVSSIGKRAHSARAWMGTNAIHGVEGILSVLNAYEPETVMVDGLGYREGLNAVGINGGVAGNVIPDHCAVTINYRFAPSSSIEEATAHVRELFVGYDFRVVDAAPGAMPGVESVIGRDFVSSLGVEVKPKFGWTDVARFSQWGIPAVNFGPGDPSLAHADDERVEISSIDAVYDAMKRWLDSPS
ncbi:MAG: succinyl-diaminopimelate desuccinylase [Microbacteriaceae bacterium BACL25 MAG-120322-bin65]|nr:MAG: succinyl-diaminopimelate desuccinylase [Microbacteriaceae bacterium BACL25 MAG-120322-bin65]